MELCIKTKNCNLVSWSDNSFNPCFNGTMYKNPLIYNYYLISFSFNPCFNGTMYKNSGASLALLTKSTGFNPCFNGTMYKNIPMFRNGIQVLSVSILVLMELCIKTRLQDACFRNQEDVSILVLMELCIKTLIVP